MAVTQEFCGSMAHSMGPRSVLPNDRNLYLPDKYIRLIMSPLNEQGVRRVRFYRSRYDNKPTYLLLK